MASTVSATAGSTTAATVAAVTRPRPVLPPSVVALRSRAAALLAGGGPWPKLALLGAGVLAVSMLSPLLSSSISGDPAFSKEDLAASWPSPSPTAATDQESTAQPAGSPAARPGGAWRAGGPWRMSGDRVVRFDPCTPVRYQVVAGRGVDATQLEQVRAVIGEMLQSTAAGTGFTIVASAPDAAQAKAVLAAHAPGSRVPAAASGEDPLTWVVTSSVPAARQLVRAGAGVVVDPWVRDGDLVSGTVWLDPALSPRALRVAAAQGWLRALGVGASSDPRSLANPDPADPSATTPTLADRAVLSMLADRSAGCSATGQ